MFGKSRWSESGLGKVDRGPPTDRFQSIVVGVEAFWLMYENQYLSLAVAWITTPTPTIDYLLNPTHLVGTILLYKDNQALPQRTNHHGEVNQI